MALTRKLLEAMGIESDKVSQIIEAHTETVDALKAERDGYKTEAEKLPTVQKKLDDALEAAKNSGEDAYKVKYDALKEEFEGFKTEQTAKEAKSAKMDAYRALLKEAGVSDKRIEAVLKVSNVDGIELVDGKIKDAEKLTEGIKADWADFIVTPGEKGARVDTPPKGDGNVDTTKMTDAEYFKYQRDLKKG